MVRMKAILIGFALALCLASPAVVADNDDWQPGTIHPALEVGFAFGGDRLATRHYAVGGHSTVYAGKGLYLGLGVLDNFDDSPWSFKGMVAQQTGFSTGFSTSINFTRYPVDGILLYTHGRQHLGFGLTYQANPKFNPNNGSPDIAFHDAWGPTLEYQYRFVGLRYTYARYRAVSTCLDKCSYDGSYLAFFFNFVF
jgi:opacity protein-like surface antigen